MIITYMIIAFLFYFSFLRPISACKKKNNNNKDKRKKDHKKY
jgi:hypothetical protein